MCRMFPQLCTTRQQHASLNIIEEQGTPVENEEQSAIDQDTTGTLMYTNLAIHKPKFRGDHRIKPTAVSTNKGPIIVLSRPKHTIYIYRHTIYIYR